VRLRAEGMPRAWAWPGEGTSRAHPSAAVPTRRRRGGRLSRAPKRIGDGFFLCGFHLSSTPTRFRFEASLQFFSFEKPRDRPARCPLAASAILLDYTSCTSWRCCRCRVVGRRARRTEAVDRMAVRAGRPAGGTTKGQAVSCRGGNGRLADLIATGHYERRVGREGGAGYGLLAWSASRTLKPPPAAIRLKRSRSVTVERMGEPFSGFGFEATYGARHHEERARTTTVADYPGGSSRLWRFLWARVREDFSGGRAGERPIGRRGNRLWSKRCLKWNCGPTAPRVIRRRTSTSGLC